MYDRTKEIFIGYVQGQTLESLAEGHHVSVTRVRQIIFKTVRQCIQHSGEYGCQREYLRAISKPLPDLRKRPTLWCNLYSKVPAK